MTSVNRGIANPPLLEGRGEVRIAGIKRNTKYSPNHIGNDGMIFNLTSEHLTQLGYVVDEYIETEFVIQNIKADCIFNLARDKSTIKRLQKLENEGAVVINSGFGIDNCMRANMTRLLVNNQIPHPASIIVDTNDDCLHQLEAMNAKAFWVKRGDSHAIHHEDVAYARSIEEVQSILQEFALRDIPNAVVNEHLVGDLIKFYGVANTDFFFWFYPFDLNHSKFGHEAINGDAQQYPFSLPDLKHTCSKAAEVLNIDIYGGDCIVDTDGSFNIIDFNDWPSFAPCRSEAAPYLAECIDKKIRKSMN